MDVPRNRQAATLAAMNSLRAERNEGQAIYLVSRFPQLSELKSMTFLGSFSWTSKATNERWIMKDHAYNLGGGWCTPSDIARDYLTVKFGDTRLRCNSKQWAEVVKKKKHQPLYAEPCSLPNAYYIDLRSAYWQILQIGGWDIDYMPRRFLSPRSDVFDFPVPEIKLARNCLVSMGLPNGVNVWIPDYGFAKRSPQKANVNLILWGFVQDILHGVASDMVKKAGAIYVNTDGYIIPNWAMPLADEVADSWGLKFGIKEQGRAEVRGAGDYDIGGHRSARLRTVPRSFSYIKPRALDWLRGKVKYWSYRVNLEQPSVWTRKESDFPPDYNDHDNETSL